MTTLNSAVGPATRPHLALRLSALLFAVLLILQCLWLLATELVRPSIDQLPTDIVSAAAAAKQRDAAMLAASIGGIRGDLWADAAFTNADLLWGEKGPRANVDLAEALPHSVESLDRALRDSPHLSSAWLFLAGLALRFPSLDLDPKEPLKMSYYTGPSEQDLVPLRLRIAAQSNKLSDVEMQDFVGRDIRFLLDRKDKSAISEAYNIASSAGRSLIEQAIRNIDPSALDALQTGARKQPFPD